MITDHGDNDAASADGDDDINGGVVMTIDSDCCDGMGGDGDDERCCSDEDDYEIDEEADVDDDGCGILLMVSAVCAFVEVEIL